MARQHISALTGIRGVAALWVMLHHLSTQYSFQGNMPTWLEYAASKGWLGVDLFFILSGFVISYVHQTDFEDGVRASSWKRFMILRFARVYPVHFVTTVSLIPIYLLASTFFNYQSPVEAFSVVKLVHSLTLTNGLGLPSSGGWNAPSWSVGAELFAYLVFPWLTWWIFARRMSVLTCVTGCIVILIFTTSIGWYLSEGERYFANKATTLLRITSEFSVGCLLYNIYKQVNNFSLWLLSLIASLLLLIMLVIDIPSKWDGLFLVAFSLLIIGLSEHRGLVARMLGNRCWVYLGEISYSIYLCHGIVFMVLNSLLPRLLPELHWWSLFITAPAYILSVWLISHYMYHYVEVRARTYIKNKWL